MILYWIKLCIKLHTMSALNSLRVRDWWHLWYCICLHIGLNTSWKKLLWLKGLLLLDKFLIAYTGTNVWFWHSNPISYPVFCRDVVSDSQSFIDWPNFEMTRPFSVFICHNRGFASSPQWLFQWQLQWNRKISTEFYPIKPKFLWKICWNSLYVPITADSDVTEKLQLMRRG